MIKFDFDIDIDENELAESLKERVNTALAAAVAETEGEGRKLASERLDTGLEHWNNGFKVHKIDENFYMLTIEGKLAGWMEDGMKRGEVSDSIMSGNRIKHNKADGKDYVDVPIEKVKGADDFIKGSGISIKHFTNADAAMKSVTMSDYKNKGVKTQKRVVQRVHDIIKSTNPKGVDTQYMTIRRVTRDSEWPAQTTRGARVFEDLERFIEKNLDSILARFI